jgi:hypothetical protein
MMKLINPMINLDDLMKNAEQAIGERFRSIPNTHILLKRAENNTLGPDYILKLRKPHGSKTILFEVKNNGQPREARITIQQIQRQLKNFPNAYGVMVAPYISDQAAEVCEEANIGVLDLAGNCRLAFDDVFIESKGAPNPFNLRRDLRTIFSPKSSRVLRVLLNQPRKIWTVQELSRVSTVSMGQVSNVKNLLDYREWIEISKEGIKLTRPKELLEEWVKNYSFSRDNFTERFYSLNSFEEQMTAMRGNSIGMKILGFNNRFALTGYAGANFIFPYVRNNTVSIYVDDIEFWIPRLGLKRVENGENIFLVRPYDEGVFDGTEIHEGVPVVSPIQLYLDLETAGCRGQDAAEKILNEVILKKW